MSTITCNVRENDKYPDDGSCSFAIKVADLKTGKNTFKDTAIVTEDRGRYAWNEAEWQFTLTVTKTA